MLKKTLIIFGVIIVLGLAIAGILFDRLSRDIGPFETPDLEVVRPELSPDQNAYTSFVAAGALLDWQVESSFASDYLAGKPMEEPLLTQLITKNQPALDLVRQGLERQHCFSPEILSWNTPFDYLRQWGILGHILAIKTRHDRLSGRFDTAVESCITLLRFANLIQADSQCLLEYIVGIRLLDEGLNQTQDLIRDDRLPADALTRLSHAISQLGPFAPGLITASKCEYRVQCIMMLNLLASRMTLSEYLQFTGSDAFEVPEWLDRPMPAYVLQPNKTKLKFANSMREMIQKIPLCYAQMQPFPKAGKELLGQKGWKMRPNSVGKVFFALSAPAHQRVFEQKCRAECNLAATQILLGLTRYRHSKETTPGSLEALVPEYLQTVPSDPYDGKPFRFSPGKGVIYSVGEDLIDSGGSELEPGRDPRDTSPKRRWKAEDVVYKLEAAKEAS